MIDKYGRKIEYVRISVTDGCNFRCIYCMPEGEIQWQQPETLLTDDEILCAVRAFARLGISRIKVTGGEPLLRENIESLIKAIKAVPGIETVTLTTNGVLLSKKLQKLYEAGLDGINISIDAVTPEGFERLTGCGTKRQLEAVQTAIREAMTFKDMYVKLNCVPIKGVNDSDCRELLEYAKTTDIAVRFIEMMPIGLGKRFEAVTEEDIKAMLGVPMRQVFVSREYGGGPCRYYRPEGYKGLVGFISAVSHKFCDSCNRLRLTSDGFLKTCLQYDCGEDLREIMRSIPKNEVDIKLDAAIKKAILNKPKAHHFESGSDKDDEQKKMFQIGG